MNTDRVIVIGCPGSGKSTFARRYAALTELSLFHLDLIYHRPDRTTVSREVFDHRLETVILWNWVLKLHRNWCKISPHF